MGRVAGSEQGSRQARGTGSLRRRQPVLSDSSAPDVRQTAWQLWCDGSAKPNPGRIGVGLVLISPEGERTERSSIAGRQGCNNEAEVLALIEGLHFAREAGAHNILVYSDSDFVVRHLTGEQRTEISRLTALIAEAESVLQGFASVQWQWIPRHRNPDADRLSRQALGLTATPAKSRRKKRRR